MGMCPYYLGLHFLVAYVEQFCYLEESAYPLVVGLAKLSICVQYLHIFVIQRDIRFWCITIFMFINGAYFFSCLFITVFQCNPREKLWDLEIPGTCLDY